MSSVVTMENKDVKMDIDHWQATNDMKISQIQDGTRKEKESIQVPLCNKSSYTVWANGARILSSKVLNEKGKVDEVSVRELSNRSAGRSWERN